ncbi:MAG: hypothetical protein UU81_C0050G0009 [Microgenomates group bacterium GW2011_GWC1_41_8]|uniref:Addiction module toxin, RelE/StbE family n=3 Tax=Candidatus Roizmaniibacteriota TaxID=1752723 RepID=A0A0G0ZGA9_9BACT|nr:MAG: hypothetical protein UT85_C0003G0016 [Candidatus Levybacteria bacterium GW2011_GWA2_40_16]KKR72027.1 MAG: hypothetical protein UU14_C0013G0001 [Candidatus Roizmanbacteria bacterium GW2011_GWB1_40_7]KKR94407.1 MAG: hypothetical protein UU41_C0007G0040 [Candidatus Roizmanbacteria bacterium GW2011_GWA1_41_13]KKS21071.1 MAG: hypothetical protein UU78_C0044G0001 [Candidatus Roizmanbacteria bacterium GW2011_GWC2_41_7]KKS22673.1 MAG: hypothetical protein UU81_C0050G0009 [Microgenomates group b
MKPIKRTKRFDRHYKERIAQNDLLNEDFVDAVDTFLQDPTSVHDHALKGVMTQNRAFSINNDYRVIYEEKDDYYLFKDIGTHVQIYHQ